MAQLSDGKSATASAEDYERARKQVEKKRKFQGDLVAYVVINAFLIGVWALSGHGYFWPGWVLAGWGVMLVMDGWRAFLRRPVTDADIQAELRRGR